MGGNVVDRRTDAAGKAAVAPQRRSRLVGGQETRGQGVERLGCHTGEDVAREKTQASLGDAACSTNARDIDGGLQAYLCVHGLPSRARA